MLIRIGLLSLWALAACSDEPKPAEPVQASEGKEAPAVEEKAGDKEVATSPAPSPASAPASAPAAAPAPASAPAKGSTYWVFVDGANLRDTPSLSGKVVGKLNWSEQVTGLGETKGFVKIGDGKFVHRTMLTDRKKRFGHGQSH